MPLERSRGLLDAEALLQQIPDWRDISSWPIFPRGQATAKRAAKQEDSESKKESSEPFVEPTIFPRLWIVSPWWQYSWGCRVVYKMTVLEYNKNYFLLTLYNTMCNETINVPFWP